MRFRLLLIGSILLAGCAEAIRELEPIDATRVVVYFPIDRGRVFGSGFAGATVAPFVYVVSHPPRGTRPDPLIAVDRDGGFSFDLVAEAGDTIEIAAAHDRTSLLRGPPLFVRVPQPLNPTIGRFYCCASTNTCQSQFDIEEGVPCRGPESGLTRCEKDGDCFHLANEVLPIDVSRIEVTPPDADGLIAISGSVLPAALVTVENRALSALGEGEPRWKRTTIADLDGRFGFTGVAGRGDDELVIQLRDIENLRSPPAQLIVPDPPFTSLDIVSVEGFEAVAGDLGIVAVRVAPGGADGRGLCPDSAEDPSTCFTGGLFHSMVTSVSGRLAKKGGQPELSPRAATVEPLRPHIVGAQGELRDGPKDYVVVIDASAGAAAVDPSPPRRFAAAAELVRRLRDRDRVALVTIGGDSREVPLGPAEPVLAALDALSRERPAGTRDLFAAMERARALLDPADARTDEIVAIMTGDVPGGVNQAIEQAAATRLRLRDRRVHIATIGGGGNLEALRRLARSGDPPGEVFPVDSTAALERAVLDLAHELVGSFVLLYEVDLPDAGKQECVEIELTARIGGNAIEARYRGAVTLQGAAGVSSSCD